MPIHSTGSVVGANTSERRSSRIADFDLKLAVCYAILDETTPAGLVREVFEGKYESLWEGAVDSLRKGNMPTRGQAAKAFWAALPTALEMPDMPAINSLIEANIDTFLGFLPVKHRDIAALAVNTHRTAGSNLPHNYPVSLPATTSEIYSDFRVIRLGYLHPHPTLREGWEEGKIDQMYHYLDPDSSKVWFGLIESQYRHYDYCSSALRALLKSPKWRSAVDTANPKAVVMLTGGGAPTKDLIIIEHFINTRSMPRLSYYILDISFYMLRDSMLWLSSHAPNRVPNFTKVNLEAWHMNVLEMTEWFEGYFHQHGSVLFAITGGTIGNLPEKRFFDSLNRASRSGDLLIVSADTLDNVSAMPIDTLAQRYKIPEFNAWLQPVVRAVLSVASSRDSVNDALKRVTFERGSDTDVKDAVCVVPTLKIGKRPIKLVSSARYDPTALMEFCKGRGWEPVVTVPCPEEGGKSFKQMLFRRN